MNVKKQPRKLVAASTALPATQIARMVATGR